MPLGDPAQGHVEATDVVNVLVCANSGFFQHLAVMLTSLLTIWQFWVAIIVSGCGMVLWAWVLPFVPLAKAYPFVVLAFVFAAIFDSVFFGQSLSLKFFLGCALILAGLIVIVR